MRPVARDLDKVRRAADPLGAVAYTELAISYPELAISVTLWISRSSGSRGFRPYANAEAFCF
jgi:hypothetical protein